MLSVTIVRNAVDKQFFIIIFYDELWGYTTSPPYIKSSLLPFQIQQAIRPTTSVIRVTGECDWGLDETMQLVINLKEPGTKFGWPSECCRLQPYFPCLTEASQELCDLGEAAKPPYKNDWRNKKDEYDLEIKIAIQEGTVRELVWGYIICIKYQYKCTF